MPRARAYKSRLQVVSKGAASGPVAKDLLDGVMEAGVHAHVLDRGLQMTDVSGPHDHTYLLPTGEIVSTDVDGMHRHTMDDWDPNGVYGGVHAHKIGDEMTEADGWHHHSLQSGTTLLDGAHSHVWVAGDMTLESLWPHEIFALRAFSLAAALTAVDREYEVTAHFKSSTGAFSLRWNEAVITCALARGDGATYKAVTAEDFTIHGSDSLLALAEAPTAGIEVVNPETDYGDEIAKGTLEVGLLTSSQAELFLQLPPPFAGTLTIERSDSGVWSVKHATAGVPGILRPGAPAPTCKRSCLPASLRADIPEGAQFWKSTDPASASMLRDWLIETEYFTKDAAVRLVGGQIRKVHTTTEYFGHEVEQADADFDVPTEVQRALGESSVSKYYTVPAGQAADAVAKFQEAGTLLATDDTAEARKALAEHGRLFKLRDHDAAHLVFAANVDTPNADVSWVTCARKRSKRRPSYASKAMDKLGDEAAERVYKTLSKVKILREDDDEEERFVYGISMEPDATDSHGDFQTAATIRTAAHKFMEDFGNVGLQHRKYINGQVKILESAIAMSDFMIGGEKVVKGTWIFAVRVLDDDLWAAVKSGDIGGFSIGGMAIRDPLDEAA